MKPSIWMLMPIRYPHDAERHFRDRRLLKIAPLSQEMVSDSIAEHVPGLARSY